MHISPCRAEKIVKRPTISRSSEVGIPAHSDPIQFQPLYIEFCCRVFQIVGRPHVLLGIEKPVGCTNICFNVNTFWLKSHGSRRGHQSIALRATRLLSE